MAMLEVNHLAIQFGGLRAVDGFNVSIEKGQLYGLIGPNGAGKQQSFTFSQVYTNRPRVSSNWTDRISQVRARSRSTKQVSREHSRTSVCSRICRFLTTSRSDFTIIILILP